ncbi:FAD-dependent oxidoreductase [Luteimonas kalidii]|uniref:D-amino-acid oxidase n=1 Tax=Luteimonas kalidii TaxID=3042025 RepID=A0ABT6JWQ3_9GAMM|nr:FAD-dependent oxidoreductase [Luteimonas kalidii]MDH5835117.1 FAD-dependent oxidoreductase [Luteimonas kalidii]
MRSDPADPASGRRRFLHAAGASALALAMPPLLGGCATTTTRAAAAPSIRFAQPAPLVAIRASADRIIAIDVCTRPFRAQGPRIEAERMDGHTIVHCYGHGGAGWSLSWGSAEEALALVRETGVTELAVVGCGAIGLTTALLAQRSGLQVRIYARDRLPQVPSAFATGVWSPASRIAAAEHATPAFEAQWERMARTSFHSFQTLLGLPGEPVGWHDFYWLSDGPGSRRANAGEDREPRYAMLEGRLLDDLTPDTTRLSPGSHPFAAASVRRTSQPVFNLHAYARLLLADFLQLGGTIETRTFHAARELATLRETTVVNATGYGARALLDDASVVPVRGQTARLVPQAGVDYGLGYGRRNLFVVPRADGILVQAQQPTDYGNADTTPDRALSEAAVARLAEVFA